MLKRSIVFGGAFGFFLLMPLAGPAGAADDPLSVPPGSSVTVDGTFGDGEWADAARRSLPGGIELLAKRDAEALELALRFTDTKHSGLDLYLAVPGGAPRLFHISSELGTKTWADGAWSDFDWNTHGWTGNTIELEVSGKDLTIYEPDGFELRLDRAMLDEAGLGGDTLLLSFRLKRPLLTVPPGAEAAPLEEWLPLHLRADSQESAGPRRGGRS